MLAKSPTDKRSLLSTMCGQVMECSRAIYRRVAFLTVILHSVLGCGRVSNNTLLSPGYPDKYPDNMDCAYSVDIPHGMAMKITFNYFDLEEGDDCEYDYLEIKSKNNKANGKYCGYHSGHIVKVTGRFVNISFHSDRSDSRRGYNLSFSTAPLDQFPNASLGNTTGCGSYRVSNNILLSPGYPNKYPNNMDCAYSVDIPHGKAMVITFNYFDLEYHPSCGFDYLSIKNENNEAFGTYCGSRSGVSVIVTGQFVNISFQSDDSWNMTGYNLSFSATEQPEFTAQPQSRTVAEGNSVTLSCNARGNPGPTFSWTKDGTTVDTDANPSITLSSQNKELTISSVTRTDSGQYRCIAENDYGTVTSNASTLDVQYQPEFTAQPQSETVIAGNNVTLSCNASGNPGPTFSWTKDGTTVNTNANPSITLSSQNKELTISNVNRRDIGQYRCIANNAQGTVTSSGATLVVQYEPEFTVQPLSQAVKEGNDITLSCNASGNPGPTFSWTKDGTTVNTTANPRITLSSQNKQLTITNVSRTDREQYRCIASNAQGTVNSSAATLDAQYQPEFTAQPQSQTVRERNKVSLSCNASGNPKPTFSWTKDGTTVNTDANPRITLSSQNKMLTIPDVSRTDSGQYRCVANNVIGTVTSYASTLVVQYQPEFTAQPESQTATLGNNVTLSCNANGNPEPTFSWTKDGTTVNTDANPRITLSSQNKMLTIPDVSRTDSGQYRCVANNVIGTVTSYASTLVVQYQPEFTAQPESQTATLGNNVTLSCNANGNPEPTFSWTKDGTTVNANANPRVTLSSQNKQLTITNMGRTDSGQYRCIAYNSIGSAVTSNAATLDVELNPIVLGQLTRPTETSKAAIYGPVIGVLAVLLISVVAYFIIKQRYRNTYSHELKPEEMKEPHFNGHNDTAGNDAGNMELTEVTDSPESATETSPLSEVNK